MKQKLAPIPKSRVSTRQKMMTMYAELRTNTQASLKLTEEMEKAKSPFLKRSLTNLDGLMSVLTQMEKILRS